MHRPVYLEIPESLSIRDETKIKHMSQMVALTGLDTHKFNAALEGISAIHSALSKDIRYDNMLPWTPGMLDKWITVVSSNRYFATGTTAKQAHLIPFDTSVDPSGVLAAVNERYQHTTDNHVGYFERELKENGVYKCVACQWVVNYLTR